MAITQIHKRIYKQVDDNSSENLDYVPAAGETLHMLSGSGHAGTSPDTVSCLIWDPGGAQEEIIFCTHGDTSENLEGLSYEGDGTRIMRIRLTNDQQVADLLGANWIARSET